jgi:hypothetical protein
MMTAASSRRRKGRQVAAGDDKKEDDGTRASAPSYSDRPSSGRPGSPHRYFESSYDVTFAHDNDDGDDDNNCEDENADGCADDAPPSEVQVLALHGRGRQRTTGTQVVHRHPNGLCVITAGNVLELSMGGSIESDRNGDGGAPPPAPTVASVRYHVSVGADAQSARGKLRARNKKWPKRDGNRGVGPTIAAGNAGAGEGVGGMDARGSGIAEDDANDLQGNAHNGNVEPDDPLCTVTLSDGRRLVLRCCVGGTIIEVNRRLLCPTTSSSSSSSSSSVLSSSSSPPPPLSLYSPSPSSIDIPIVVPGVTDADGTIGLNSSCPHLCLSKLFEDPLLDGYLAVIMPAKRGAFPPIREGR